MSNIINKIIKGKDKWQSFNKRYTLEERKKECAKIRKEFPGKIPVIIEPASDKDPEIDKHKYLFSPDVLVGQFIYNIRSRIKLNPEEALFFFINNKLPVMSETMGSLYESEKDEAGFIVCKYSKENSFG